MRIADRRAVPEATGPEGRLTFKTAETASGQMIALDDAEGIVTAVVSVTGTEDEVADIIVPGAYRETLNKRRPKVCWAHSWEHPIGRVLHIEELMPGDDRLPTEDKDGNPWSPSAGALVATMQFNMRTREGKDAFEAVRFYSETGECEYSIGYQVPAGKATRDGKGVRHIKALDLYELSVVLFGAHTKTGTLSIKAALAQITERKSNGTGTTGIEQQQQTPRKRLTAKEALAALKPAPKPDDAAPDFSNGVMIAVYPDPEAADKLAQAVAGTDEVTPREEFHVTLAYLGRADSLSMDSDEVVRRVSEVLEGESGLRGTIGGLGTFPPSDDGDDNGSPTWVPVDVPGLSLLRETVVSALGDVVATDHGFTPHITIGWNLGAIDPIEPIPVTFTQVSVVYGPQTRTIPLGTVPDEDDEFEEKAMGPLDEYEVKMSAEERRRKPTMPGEGDRYPIGNREDLENAIRAYGRAKDSDKPKVMRWIKKRARELDLVNLIPEGWSNEGGSKSLDLLDLSEVVRLTAIDSLLADEPEAKAGGADRNRGNAEELRRYWTTGAGGAKIRWGTEGDFTRCARYLSEHMTPERAKGYCANRHKEMTGMWPGDKNNKVTAYDPAMDAGSSPETKGPDVAGGKGYPRLPGSFEERQDALNAAVNEALRGDPLDDEESRWEWDHVNIDATFADHVVATRMKWGPEDRRETFEVDYTYDPDDGVSLGEPDRVELQVVLVGMDDDGYADEAIDLADTIPFEEDVLRIAHTFKAAHAALEGKAGRVLSGRNERALRLAVENLVNVLAAAGVKITVTEVDDEEYPGDSGTTTPTARQGDPRKPMRPGVDVSTTSPSASVKGHPGSGEVLTIDMDEHKRLIEELEAITGSGD